ncbi:teneurin-m-like isoform X2 [Physella acuta]|uniref:teneurin-m-like isoform X2 n=1 Tax=Physella acuta TaxID=109671 RepID=UPI0027DC71F5|nr:teneurin-m-like isoform X2 [Physella acuta]
MDSSPATSSLANGVGSGSVRSARQAPSAQRSSKKARTKNRGSQTCSSDDEDLHSDDNLRPYEEVKVAHHDKKLIGLGLTPNEHAVSPIMPTNQSTPKQNSRSGGRAYSYGSDDESEARVPLQGRPSIYQQQQRPMPAHPQHEHVVYDPPWDHINFDQMRSAHRTAQTSESDEDNRHALQRYSQAGTLPMPPPTFPPPPPPPPIEDIPQRSPAPSRQRSFGPSMRGNYSDTDFRRQQTFSDGEHDQPMENPYMVQNALGAAYSMEGQALYQHQRPPMHRSGSVPSGHSHAMDASDHYISSGHSDTYPYHCPNAGDGSVITHTNDRQLMSYPQFGITPSIPAGSYQQDYRYYSKFSSAGNRMQKKLQQRCTWRCTALILLVMCVGLLACTVYFAATSMSMEEKVEKDCTTFSSEHSNPGHLSPPQNRTYNRYDHTKFPGHHMGYATSEPPSVLIPGRLASKSVPPGTFWMNQLEQKSAGSVKLNLSVPSDAKVGIYGRKGMPPSHIQFDFFKVIDGIRMGVRSKRAVLGNDYFARDTALVQYMDRGNWFIGIFNDRETYQSIVLTATAHAMETNCPNDCHGNGECKDRICRCFPGYTGWDCSQGVCPLLCSGNGVYLRGQCQCNQGWKGVECDLRESECAVPSCNNNGHCINGQCVCFTGFQGSDCAIVDCLMPNCSGNGACILGTCHCFRGFKGPDCKMEDKINVTQLCSKNCSGNGLYDVDTSRCDCKRHFTGISCETEICRLECIHGRCENQRCVCASGWAGALCDQLECNHRCDLHGQCNNGSCMCDKGWNGKHCTLNGCPGDCYGHGHCRRYKEGWRCECKDGWKGEDCNLAKETSCSDRVDNDHDGLVDCLDPDCCSFEACVKSQYCQASPDPKEILLRNNAPAPTASFLDKMRFLIEENSVQMDAPRNSFNESQVSVIRGRVQTPDGTPLIGVRVGVVTQPLYGFTLTREEGQFDILVNGGGSVTLEFVRDPFITQMASVLVPWNQIITMDSIVMNIESRANMKAGTTCSNMENNHDHYLLRPVVLSTWQHTQLGACPERSTIIPESQVLQESQNIPGTDVHLVYHSSESSGYMSLIMIQMTPSNIPHTLSMVHLRVSVQGVEFKKIFEADPNLKYTFAWDRLNAYKQKVYGIVTARVYVGYQYLSCDHIYWETRSATLNGYDMTASHIGGWNLDIHHTYNYQEGILHKGDGTNIYLKEKPKKIINILGSGQRRKLTCDACNGKAMDNSLLSPVALASGLDGSLYVGDYNFIRKLSPLREEIANILEISTMVTPYKFYMTVSPVDGRLYISDFMSHKIIRVRTMGPVPDLADNSEVVAGNGEECTPGETDLCGDGGPAVNARLRYPKGIAISKDGIIYVADGPNIRKITPDGSIGTLIGTQTQPREWTPMPCDDILSAERVSLKWPTSLSINPLDDSLHILDHSIVLKLTSDFKLVTVAGRPIYCPPRHSSFLPLGVLTDDEQASNVADHVTLVSPKSITFGPHGDLYIVESDTHHINRVRVVSTDGRIHHFAGAKSKCDCRQEKCACFNPRETLAAQALFSDPTSVTVTPDGVLHLADMGNLRVFSVVSELPILHNSIYEVLAPETQELYIFNKNGQHQQTINIHTGQYIYNFTYNVLSSYGKLVNVIDAAQNKIIINRTGESHASELILPSGQKCTLSMDNRHRLHKYKASNNLTSTFTYTVHTGLLESKQDSDGQTFFFHYDDTGRLLTVRQPTGQITTLTTDINTTGSIVHVATGSTQTKVTYLPDGAVIVLFPSNLTVSLETGSHPIMENENRMHYKRKIIVPGSSVHRLEWRFYLRRGGRVRSSRVIEKLGLRSRVGDLARQHVVHDSLGGEGRDKALMINGESLLTVEYDRRTHTETVLDKSLRDIITVAYNSAGLPVQFIPASSHHAMNVTYNAHGDIVEWQYGELIEQREYISPGLITQRTLKPGGKQFRYFYRNSSNKPTDVFLPSGKQYLFKHDKQGNLKSVISPVLGHHHFRTLLTLGMKRYLYTAPGFSHPYIEDYDAMGKLIQKIYPSEERRVVYRYNSMSQRSLTMFDQTLIEYTYHPAVLQLSQVSLVARGYSNKVTFGYLSSLVHDVSVTFPQDASLVGATIRFSYDNHFRQTETFFTLTNNISLASNQSFNNDNGKLSSIAGISVEWLNEAKQVLSLSPMSLTREFDSYGRLVDYKMKFSGDMKFEMQINYDKIGRVHQWKRKLDDAKELTTEYIYDVDSHVTDVLMQGKNTWDLGYDADGNLKKITSQGKTHHMEFDVGDKLISMGSLGYKFDSDGFMAQRGLDHVSFNSDGQLVSVTQHGSFKFSFFYDALGRLAVQRDRYGHMLQLYYGDTRASNTITHTYNHTTGVLTQYFRDTDGTLVALQRAGRLYFIVVDPNKSPLVVFDKEGNTIKSVTYSPLGIKESDSNPDFELVFGFQGGLYNSIAQLVHFPSRVYDAQTGRYMSPDYPQVFKKLDTVAEDPEILNLYVHRYLVNGHLQNERYPRMDLSDWLNALGYDIKSMAPDVSYTGQLKPGPDDQNMQLLPASSAFECTFRRDMHNLLSISTVPRSKVTPLQYLKPETPAPLDFIFGHGVTISDFDGRTVVNVMDAAQLWPKKLATVLLNSSQILPIHFTINGRDCHYFVKPSIQQATEDLRELGIHSELITYESGINVSVHHNPPLHLYSPAPKEVDIKIHGNHTVLNVRYGTTVDREMRRILKQAKDRAVNHAWSRERFLLQHNLPSMYHWSESELRQILSVGSVMGYVPDYNHQPDQYPELSDDCNNIRFVAEVP